MSKKPLRLYEVHSNRSTHLRRENGQPAFFSTKAAAKAARDEANKHSALMWHIAPGPDHWKRTGRKRDRSGETPATYTIDPSES